MSSRGFWTQKKLKKLKEHIRFSQIVEKNSMLPPQGWPETPKMYRKWPYFFIFANKRGFYSLKIHAWSSELKFGVLTSFNRAVENVTRGLKF